MDTLSWYALFYDSWLLAYFLGLDDTETLSSLHLDGWRDKIMEMKAFFHNLYFHHVFRENNKREYSISKEVLPMVVGLLSFTENYEEIAIGEDKI